MFGNCEECPGNNHLAPTDDVGGELCSWIQWRTTEEDVSKEDFEGTVSDCFQQLQKVLPNFLKHTYIKRIQAKPFIDLREHVKPNEIVVQIDFSENYECKEQNEIQSAHWAHTRVSVFTGVVWYLHSDNTIKSQLYAFVSDYKQHDKYCVHVCLHHILEDMRAKTKYNRVHLLSDGAASQFKQKYNLCNLTYLKQQGIEPSWHFFATSHGKGAVDRVGGEVKRRATEFVKVVEKKVHQIRVKHIPNEVIENIKGKFDKRWLHITAVPGTQKMHCVKVNDVHQIAYARYSASVDWSEHDFSIDQPDQNAVISASIKIETGKYCAVYYNSRFYIGRVISFPSPQMVKVKFLCETFADEFEWPSTNDIDTISTVYLFHGPLELEGMGPFHIRQTHAIRKGYKEILHKQREA